jgi:hypothetical protein
VALAGLVVVAAGSSLATCPRSIARPAPFPAQLGWSDEVVVELPADSGPYLPLAGGHRLAAVYEGDASLVASVERGATALSAAAGDLDGDGVADLVVGGRTDAGPVLAVFSGRDPRSLTDGAPPFASTARLLAAPARPDVLAVADVDGDGAPDVVLGARGAESLWWLSGAADLAPSELALDGRLTGFAAGEVFGRDGAADLAVAVVADGRNELQLFHHPAGALHATPLVAELPGPAAHMVIAPVDGVPGGDVLVVAGSRLVLVSGSPIGIAARAVPVEGAVFGVSVGDLVLEAPAHNEVAALTADGVVVLDLASPTAKWGAPQAAFQTPPVTDGAGSLAAARLASLPTEEVVQIAPEGLTVVMTSSPESGLKAARRMPVPAAPAGLQAPADRQWPALAAANANPVGDDPPATKLAEADSDIPPPVQLATTASPVAVMAMRLGADALADLAVVTDDDLAPAVVFTKNLLTVTVDSTTDVADGDTSSITALEADKGADGVISLREAIMAADATSGLDTIAFNIPAATDTGCVPATGVCTIAITGDGLPVIFDAITINAITQPGYFDHPLIVLDGSGVSAGTAGLAVAGGGTTIRGLATSGFATNSDIVLFFAGGDVVEVCHLGIDSAGTTVTGSLNGIHISGAANCTIGGTK